VNLFQYQIVSCRNKRSARTSSSPQLAFINRFCKHHVWSPGPYYIHQTDRQWQYWQYWQWQYWQYWLTDHELVGEQTIAPALAVQITRAAASASESHSLTQRR